MQRATIAAFGMVTWDLLLDPQMVNWNFWVWENVPSFSWFGIPFLNFVGWFLVSFLMTIILQPEEVARLADKFGIAVVAVNSEELALRSAA